MIPALGSIIHDCRGPSPAAEDPNAWKAQEMRRHGVQGTDSELKGAYDAAKQFEKNNER
jgi:hypothetical protein